MAEETARVYPKKKTIYRQKFNELFDENDKIMICGVDNVQSQQLHNIRMSLRGQATMLNGKNTMMKKAMTDRLAASGSERDQKLYKIFVDDKLFQANICMIFTSGDLTSVKDIVEKERVQAPARAGSIAPVAVTVPAGNTGLEPTKTSFFQALNIPTKITKGTVEILNDQQLIEVGDKVGSSEAALLQMLGIKPFFYGLDIQTIYDQGDVYDAAVLDITDEDMKEKFSLGVGNVTALSLATGLTTAASFPHVMVNAFKNLLAISVMSDYEFSEFNGAELKDAILNGPKFVEAAPAEAAAADDAAPAAAVEEEDEEEDMGMGLFD